jgi:hypothetical protein
VSPGLNSICPILCKLHHLGVTHPVCVLLTNLSGALHRAAAVVAAVVAAATAEAATAEVAAATAARAAAATAARAVVSFVGSAQQSGLPR